MSEDNATEYVLRSQLADAVQECERLRQAIRDAEQRGREQAAQAIEANRLTNDDPRPGAHPRRTAWIADFNNAMDEAARLARGGSTDEEQTP